MNRGALKCLSVLGIVLILNLLPGVFCAEYDRESRFNSLADNEPEEPIDPIYYKDAVEEEDTEGRFFFTNGTLIPVSSSGALVVSTVGIVAVIIGGIILLLLLLSPNGLKGGLLSPWINGGYPSNSYYYPTPYYSQQQYDYSKSGGFQGSSTSRSGDQIDWDSLKILDYISMMEEMWRKLDVKDPNCQKRILCELHQNEMSLGPAASKIVNVFGYTRYLSFLNIPGPLKNMIEDYQEAADRGRSMNGRDCKEYFDSCEFSLKDTFLKKFKSD